MPRHSRLKDHHAEQRLFGRRVVAASTIVVLLLGVLFARLFWLQIVRHDYFSDLSQGNRIRIDPIPPPRGLILDRHGTPLALNRPAYQLELTREQTPDLDEAKANEAKASAEEAMKNAKSDIDFAKAQGEFAAMAAQIAALRKYRKK